MASHAQPAMGVVDRSAAPCPICGAIVARVGWSEYYALDRRFQAAVCECRSCDIFFRLLEDQDRRSHFYQASYVQVHRESVLWEIRHNFFAYIVSLITRHLQCDSRRLLDVGCSFGHMLQVAAEAGFETEGVEVNENLVALCRAKNLSVHLRVADTHAPVDVVTLIDSLYYFPQPRRTLEELRGVLVPDGLLVVRVTNRNWLIHLKAGIVRCYDFTLLGDAEISYSVRGLTRLLESTGFSLVRILPDRAIGKRVGWKMKLAYGVTSALTSLRAQRFCWAPGIIAIARRGNV